MFDLKNSSEEITVIGVYPAMAYPPISSKVKYVILNTYHSGTLNTKAQSTVEFLSKAKKKGVTVYAAGVSDGAQYSSSQAFETLGIIPIKNLSPISAYVKLWLLSAMNKDASELMQKSICGDIIE